jgi:hypothetical protein
MAAARGFASGTAGAIAGVASRSLITGSDFGDNLISELPDVVQTTDNSLLGYLDAMYNAQHGGVAPSGASDPLLSQIQAAGAASAQAPLPVDAPYADLSQLETGVPGVQLDGPSEYAQIDQKSDLQIALENLYGDGIVPADFAVVSPSQMDPLKVTADLSQLIRKIPDLYTGSSVLFGEGLTAEQFATWAQQMSDAGGLQAPGRSDGTFNNNSDVAKAAGQVPADSGGQDTVENTELDAFMKDIAVPLANLRVTGGANPEKFITVGLNGDDQLVVTSVQVLGLQGGSNLYIPDNAVAIAHTHPTGAYQAPNGGDDSYLIVTSKPSFVVGRTGSNVWEIERDEGIPQIRLIQSGSEFGPWEPFQSNPTKYTIYNDRRYPAGG